MKRRLTLSCTVIVACLTFVSASQAEPTCCPEGEACPPTWWPEGMPFPEDCIVHPPLVRISAEEAFDAYQAQEIDGQPGVMMFDVRTPEELYWVGTPAQVNEIELDDGSIIVPDDYKALLKPHPGVSQPQQIEIAVEGKTERLSVDEVVSTDLSPIAYNVPVEYLDPTTGETTLNPRFGFTTDALVAEYTETSPAGLSSVVFFCRSGRRSSVGCYYKYCPFSLMDPSITAYEVEATDEFGNEVNGLGGFESTSASNRYLGYRGFPGRRSAGVLAAESVAFKDTGLPIVIGHVPMTELGHLPALPWAFLAE